GNCDGEQPGFAIHLACRPDVEHPLNIARPPAARSAYSATKAGRIAPFGMLRDQSDLQPARLG
ncbi:MAG: hypothetical protein ABIL11_05075, partial [Chloroflexota bacterium]